MGKLAGGQVAQVSGAPCVGAKIRVRGIGSINASSDPLYVTGGFPAGNDVFINAIASIDILKDAASAAIYGARASGGVVLIMTRRGKDGKGKLDYEYQFGSNQLARNVKLHSEQFVNRLIDATARPMFDCFEHEPDATRYPALPNRMPLDELNRPLSSRLGRARQYALSTRWPVD